MNTFNIIGITALVIGHGIIVWRLEKHRRQMTDEFRSIRRRIKLADPMRGN